MKVVKAWLLATLIVSCGSCFAKQPVEWVLQPGDDVRPFLTHGGALT